jgi:hypothetical protein
MKSTVESKKITFGKKRVGKSKNLNTPKGKNIKKYRGQGK